MKNKLIFILFLIFFFIHFFNINSLATSNINDFSFTILCYHNIVETPSTDYDVSITDFSNQMKYLNDNGLTSLFATDVIEILESKRKLLVNNQKYVAITFDDGNKGVYLYADKILQENNLKATIFIYPSVIFSAEKDNKKNYMTFSMINRLISKPYFQLGCHSYYHPYMTKEDEKGLLLNTQTAKTVLLKKTGIDPITFAYPFGLYNDKVIEYVKKAGFKGAFTIDRKFANKNTDIYKIPRFIITKDTSFEKFIQIVNLK